MEDLIDMHAHRNNKLHDAQKQLTEMLDACKKTRRWFQSLIIDAKAFNVQARNFNRKSAQSERNDAATLPPMQNVGAAKNTGYFPPDNRMT